MPSWILGKHVASAVLGACLLVSAACATRDRFGSDQILHLTTKSLLRAAWSIARVRIESSDSENYGFFIRESCGHRIEATVVEALKGPSGSITFLYRDSLDPGEQYLVSITRLKPPSAHPDASDRCRMRHDLYAYRSALIKDYEGVLYVDDPHGRIVPPTMLFQYEDRSQITWTKAKDAIEHVLKVPE